VLRRCPPAVRPSVWTALLGRKSLLLDDARAPFLIACLAFRTLVLFPKLRTVEDFTSRSVNVFNASATQYSHFLSIAGGSGGNSS
jgi:hypothetical protein